MERKRAARLAYKKKYRAKNKEAIAARDKEYRDKNKEAIAAKKKEHHAKNSQAIAAKRRERYAKNADRNREDSSNRNKKRRKEDPYFRMSSNLRKRLRCLIKGSGIGKMSELTGCSGAFLRAHIESAFTRGMSWANYGKWHCDHIVPCAAFDLSCPIQRKKCYHYSNLRPLWAKPNMDKGASIEPCQPELVLCMAG